MLEDYYKKLNFVEYKRVPDGFGGWKGQWNVGANPMFFANKSVVGVP